MTRSIVYYISGHGFGHARRSAALIRRLVTDYPDVIVHIRTAAPARMFDDTVGPRVKYHPADIDPGAVEHDAIRIDRDQTTQRMAQYLQNKPRIIADELEALPSDLKLIIADLPFMAGDIAAAAGVPAIAVGNFTWDWIYEPWMSLEEEGRRMIAEIQASYRRMTAILHLPFGGRTEIFREVIEVPVIATGRRYERQQVLGKLKLDGGDCRPVVLIGQRGGIDPEVLNRAARQSPEAHFLCPLGAPPQAPKNLRPVTLGNGLRFADLIYACDVVVSKLGHGTVSECIDAGAAMLWPARTDFREDDVMATELPQYLRMRRITTDQFECGDWARDLLALLESPPPPQRMRSDGDAVCAQILSRWL